MDKTSKVITVVIMVLGVYSTVKIIDTGMMALVRVIKERQYLKKQKDGSLGFFFSL